MKFTVSLLAAVGVSARHHHHHRDVGLIQQRVQGIDEKIMHPYRSYTNPWPQGPVDDSTNDDLVIHLAKKKEEPEPAPRYHDKMRQWQMGTWPVYHTWDKDMVKATQHQQIDD